MSSEERFSVGEDGELIYYPRIGEIDYRKVCSGYENWFEVTCEAKDYNPDEIEIKVNENVIKVGGKQETNSFYTEFLLEEGVAPDSLICSIWKSAAVLIISAPIVKPSGIRTLAGQPSTKPNQPTASQTNCNRDTKLDSGRKFDQTKPADWMKKTPMSQHEKYVVPGTSDEGITIPWTEVIEDNEEIPSIANDPRFEDVTEYVCLVEDKNGIETFELNFEMKEYIPEDISIKITNRIVVIMAKHESTKGNRTSRLKMFKKFTIPEGAETKNVLCALENEILRIVVTRTKVVQQRKTLSTNVDISALEGVLLKRKDKICTPAGKIVDRGTEQ